MVEVEDGSLNNSTAIEAPAPKPKSRPKKNTELPAIERRNWLIHQHFIKKEIDTCKRLIREQLIETAGECTYALYVQSMIARNEGHINDSIELLQACERLQNKSPEVLKQIARNLFLVGKYEDSIVCYKRASKMSDKDWEISHQLGVCYLHLKQYEKAEDYLQAALESSKHDITFSTLANMYLEQNFVEKAMEILKKAVSFAPENLNLLTTLGLLHLKQGNFHESFELLGQAMTFDPENYRAILAVGSLMQIHGDFDVALTKYRVAAHKAPESAPLWNNIAMCFFGKKKYVAAVTCLKRATYLAPFDWKIQYNLALVHLTMQQYASAFQFGSSALRLKPKNANIYLLLAVSLSHLGETENARKSYDEAYNLDPRNAYIVLNFAIFLHQNNNNKKASKYVQELEKLSKEDSNLLRDKEFQETIKKLGGTLQVGDFVEPKQVPTKDKKKNSRQKRDKHAPNPHDNPTSDTPSVKNTENIQGAQTASLKGGVLSPIASLQSLPSVPQGRLPSLGKLSNPPRSSSKVLEPLG